MPPLLADRLPSVRRLWEAGRTDGEIARSLGTDRKTARKYRLRLGLPARWTPADAIRRLSAGGLIEARTAANAARRAGLATRYGLPADLAPVQVQVLLALAAGPLTRRELAARCGLPQHADQRQLLKSNHPEGSYTAHLMALGLVARVRRSGGPGSGKGGHLPSLYLLTPACLDRLAMLKESL